MAKKNCSTRHFPLFCCITPLSLLSCYLFAAVSKRADSAVLPATVVTQVLEDSLEGIYFSCPILFEGGFLLEILLQLCHT